VKRKGLEERGPKVGGKVEARSSLGRHAEAGKQLPLHIPDSLSNHLHRNFPFV
jgi:hypothetical protein